MVSGFFHHLRRFGFDVAAIEKLQATSGVTIKIFDVDKLVIRQGETPQHAYLVLEGWACRYMILHERRRQIIALLIPGDLIETEALVDRPMDHTISCLTAVTVVAIPRDAFGIMLANRHATLAQAFSLKIHEASRTQREWMLSLGQRTAPERIGHILCENFYRLRAVGLTNGNQCLWPLTQTDLADAVGLSLVHVNKRLQDLRSAGLIGLRGRTLTILDLPRLVEMARFDSTFFLRSASYPDL